VLLSPPPPRIEIPRPWQRHRYAPTRRPTSRWRRPIDTLGGHLKRSSSGHLIRLANSPRHLATTCANSGSTACAACPDGVTAACVRVTISGATMCTCLAPTGLGTGNEYTGSINGTFDLPFTSGTGTSCCYATTTTAIVIRQWSNTDCTGVVEQETTNIVIALCHTVFLGVRTWSLSATVGPDPFIDHDFFSGNFSPAADCASAFVINNDLAACVAGDIAGIRAVGSHGGSAACSPFGC
jgi:hypothetical protein